MKVDLRVENLNAITKAMIRMPGVFQRARKSALGSLGWHLRGELRDYIERGGEGWPERHPLTLMFRKKRGIQHKWIKRRKAPPHPLEWLGKFARYLIDSDGTTLQVDFGKSRRGQPGQMDPTLSAIARRAEEGETIHVTPAMRRFLATTRRKRPKRQIPGETYFPLRKSTKVLKIPPRPIFDPVWRKVRSKIGPWFEAKFWANVEAYEKGLTRSQRREIPW